LGVGTVVLSGTFWIFNFLGIGTQTEVARASGKGDTRHTRQISGLALLLGAVFGILLIAVVWPLAGPISRLMGGEGPVLEMAEIYIRIRILAAPAVLVSVAAFGSLRGDQDMRTPLYIAVGVNVLNLLLDPILIFGWGPVPALGIAGAALASSSSQVGGAVWGMAVVLRRSGMPRRLRLADVLALLRVGGDLFVRTGALTLFLIVATREATRAGAVAGAAHQAIRQVWTFTALFLDAFAVTGQSLVGFFLGARDHPEARRVAGVVCLWSLGTGVFLGGAMLLGTDLTIRILVPPAAVAVFRPAWTVAAFSQPLNALTFGTDGIHWGAGDFRYLRNAVVVATVSAGVPILLLDEGQPGALTSIWWLTVLWVSIRALFGLGRIWPGWGRAPLRPLTKARRR
ncbi:MAG: MATE family efflux transporter, partial [Thermoanaerobaculia bacterium]|nr:MATE family efflux transporter [Thermoanaerobaculia bacterium]